VGTGVLQLPLHEPLVVAKASTTLQEVSTGRFPARGAAAATREYERVGVDFTRGGGSSMPASTRIRAAGRSR
jgi:alkanesulfonate monooxygenase SsuD/methylene tetrahydromethanopterin reductase-like flavin-dependent oxidoreductase (luciferase family)